MDVTVGHCFIEGDVRPILESSAFKFTVLVDATTFVREGVTTSKLTEISNGYVNSLSIFIRRTSSFLSSETFLIPDVWLCFIWRCSFNDKRVTLRKRIKQIFN